MKLKKEKLVEALNNAVETKEPWVGKIPIGKHVRQGDVYLVHVEGNQKSDIMHDGSTDGEKSLQLAPGETKGSRHFLNVVPGVRLFAPHRQSEFLGGYIEVDEGATARVTHPTHREFHIEGPCNLQVKFPMDLSDPQQIRRLAD